MTIFLLIAVGLLGTAFALIARAFVMPRIRTSETLERIPAYGFKGNMREAEAAGGLRLALDGVAGMIGGLLGGRLGSEADLRNKLMSAGLYRTSPRKFIGYRILALFSVPAAWIWSASVAGFSPLIFILGLVMAVLAGWAAPMTVVQRRSRRRLAEIDLELPELIDLLVVTVEAGLGFNGSLRVSAERFRGALGQELRLTLQEQNMGLSTEEALRNLLARTDTPSMRSFVRSIVQGETLGVSIGQIMRNLALEMRKRRRQEAEERAQKAPIKILFPLIFLIFPAMFVILLVPAIFVLAEAFGGG
jgi:tight adherence protein C